MKKVVITGATSFIGLNLINRLIEGPYHVYAVVRPDSKKTLLLPKTKKIKIFEASMDQYKELDSIINEPCDCYFSLAWNGTRGSERDNSIMQENNYNHSIDGLKAMQRLGCKIVVSAGSQAEYGLHDGKICEDSPANPVTEYGKYKLKFYYDGRELCTSKNISFKEPRFFSLYGPNDYDGTMIISMLKNMMQNKDCYLTECIQMWDFLYITDAVDGLIALIEKNCVDGIYNFGSGISKPLRLYIEEMYKLTNSKSRLIFGSIPYPETGMVSIEPDVTKLKEQTGWLPSVAFSEGIDRIIRSLR